MGNHILLYRINKKQINKKSQIGTTLTWFVAFLIIFFIMFLFLVATAVSAGKKQIVSGKDKGLVEGYYENTKNQRALISILNQQIFFNNKNIKIKDIIFEISALDEDKKEELSSKIKEKCDNLFKELGEKECYVFGIEYAPADSPKQITNKIKVSSLNEKKYEDWINFYLSNNPINKDRVSMKFFYSGDKDYIITTAFYYGKCL